MPKSVDIVEDEHIQLNSFDLDTLAWKLKKIDNLLNRLKKEHQKYREQFLLYATDVSRDTILPRIIFSIENDWFHRVGISEGEFFQTRFPSWRVLSKKKNQETGIASYVLEKNPEYVPYTYVSENKIKISKTIQEYSPEFDWKTLQRDRPDIFDKIARPKISYELDTTALELLLKENPGILEVLNRHMVTRRPVVKLLQPKEVEDDDNNSI